jgi:hypothetical protein
MVMMLVLANRVLVIAVVLLLELVPELEMYCSPKSMHSCVY